jgi:bifunctional non-homologous end joining protein LigD
VAAAALPGARAAELQPDRIELQLARLVDAPPSGDDWLHEPKWDGYRILALIDDGEVTLWSRNRLAWTVKLPAIAAALGELGLRQAALDGELIAGKGARKDFGLLQATLSGEKKGRLSYMLFDVLHVDGIDVSGVALTGRKALLEKILAKASPPLVYSAHIAGDGPDVLEAATAQGLEGIISKRAGAPHRGGRSDDWRKSKEATSDEFAVVGFTPPKGSRAGFGALLLARPDPKHGWRYTGRLGTGFSHSQLTSLLKQLDRDTRAKPTVHVPPHDTDLRGARWIEPSVVVEAFYRGVGKEGLLRQPSLKATRPDKDVADLLAPSDAPVAEVRSAPTMTSGQRKASKPREAPEPRKAPKAAVKAPKRPDPISADAKQKEQNDDFGMRLTHPERVVFPDRGTTKGDIAHYYIAMMPWLLPEIINRPLSVIRCTQGIEKACFFQKHATAGLSKVDTVPILEESGKYADYLVVRDAESLMELVQFNAIEFHTWGSTADQPDIANRIVFDLDPGPGTSFKDLVRAARQIRSLLEELSLVSFVRVSGGKGLHVVVPLNPGCDWSIVKPFARGFAESMATREPARYVATASKARREGRIFIDYLRNGRGATSVASWSLRSRPGAPVAVPIGWDELGRLKRADAFDIDSVPARLARLEADPWQDIDEVAQDLRAVGELLAVKKSPP